MFELSGELNRPDFAQPPVHGGQWRRHGGQWRRQEGHGMHVHGGQWRRQERHGMHVHEIRQKS